MTKQGIWLNKPMMVETRSFELLSLYSGKQANFKNLKHNTISLKGVAIVPIYGILTKNPGAFDDFLGMTSYEKIREEIEKALADREIETILLDIDSPGGEVSGIFDLSDFIYNARKSKRIIAIANDDAYSAAYAIASSAEKVFLTRTSGVGSIGVIASHIDQSGWDEKHGVKYTTVFAGSRKNDLNPHEPINSEGLENLRGEIDRLYEMLVELIARNRNLSTLAVKSTEAGLYFGQNAIEIGLADEVTTFSELKEKILFTNKKEVFNMTNSKEQNSEDLIDKDKRIGCKKCRNEILELTHLCNLSRMPEKITEFIEKNISVEEAQKILMSTLAERTTKAEIFSALPQNSSEGLLTRLAKTQQTVK